MIWRRQLRWSAFWWACDWAITIGVIGGSLTPPGDLPTTLGLLNDKVMHFSAYFLMAFWFAGSLERRLYPTVGIALCVLGAAIEWVQYLMGFGRDADSMDFVADALGVSLALAIAYAGFGNWMEWVERRFALRRS